LAAQNPGPSHLLQAFRVIPPLISQYSFSGI
jgi:hypothetical protein